MAKKAVATFAAKAGAKSMVKCIRMDKSPKTGAYVFTELLVEAEKTKDFFADKSNFREYDSEGAGGFRLRLFGNVEINFTLRSVFTKFVSLQMITLWDCLTEV